MFLFQNHQPTKPAKTATGAVMPLTTATSEKLGEGFVIWQAVPSFFLNALTSTAEFFAWLFQPNE